MCSSRFKENVKTNWATTSKDFREQHEQQLGRSCPSVWMSCRSRNISGWLLKSIDCISGSFLVFVIWKRIFVSNIYKDDLDAINWFFWVHVDQILDMNEFLGLVLILPKTFSKCYLVTSPNGCQTIKNCLGNSAFGRHQLTVWRDRSLHLPTQINVLKAVSNAEVLTTRLNGSRIWVLYEIIYCSSNGSIKGVFVSKWTCW